ncbi:MAG: universal stress protein [Syntrophobacteraceae bacterium]|jgi:nucleotide-binding universal stress UspA family protein|nr:universal stress protein [Syntrophobacteraceae bacterium]
MKVLVPVDGSQHSMEALNVAMDFARMKSAEVFVISVVPFIGGMEDHEISPARRERVMEGIEKRAKDAVKLACDTLYAEGVSTSCSKTIVTSISVPDAIIDFAETEKIDLIVMGSRGLSVSSRFKLGSVATQVVKYSPCSVYLVKMPSEE